MNGKDSRNSSSLILCFLCHPVPLSSSEGRELRLSDDYRVTWREETPAAK